MTSKPDLVERLRKRTVAGMPVFPSSIELEAADEIERLEREKNVALYALEQRQKLFDAKCAEVERLRTALEASRALYFPSDAGREWEQLRDAALQGETGVKP